jgi:hypothetical protein
MFNKAEIDKQKKIIFLVTAAILNGGRGCRTQYRKGTTQGPPQPNLL